MSPADLLPQPPSTAAAAVPSAYPSKAELLARPHADLPRFDPAHSGGRPALAG